MESVPDSTLPAKVLYSIGIDDGPDRRAELIDDILDGGTTVERTRPPFPEDQHIYYDDGGAVYWTMLLVKVERTETDTAG